MGTLRESLAAAIVTRTVKRDLMRESAPSSLTLRVAIKAKLSVFAVVLTHFNNGHYNPVMPASSYGRGAAAKIATEFRDVAWAGWLGSAAATMGRRPGIAHASAQRSRLGGGSSQGLGLGGRRA